MLSISYSTNKKTNPKSIAIEFKTKKIVQNIIEYAIYLCF